MAERDPNGVDGVNGLEGLLGTAAADTARWSADPAVPVTTLEQTAWRRRRNRLTATGVIAALVVVTGAVVGTVGRSDRDTGGVSVSVAAEPPRPTRDPAPVAHELPQPASGQIIGGLPTEGVAIEEGNDVLLVSLEGEMLSRLDGFRVSEGLQRGELLLFDAAGNTYELDARAGVLARRSMPSNVTALSYGAVLVTTNPATGFGRIERAGEMLFEIGGGSSVSISWDRDIVTRTGGHGTRDVVAFDLRTDSARPLPDGCRVADRHGPAWFLLCDGSVVRLDADGDSRVLAEATETMRWGDVMASPDGRQLLAPACGSGRTFLGSTSAGDLHPLPVQDPIAPLGWSAGGDAIVGSASACGGDTVMPSAVVAVEPGGRSRTIYEPAAGGEGATSWKATMWMPVLEHD